MNEIDTREIFGHIGELIFDMEPELVELLEDGDESKELVKMLIKLEEDTEKLMEAVYKEFYKDE